MLLNIYTDGGARGNPGPAAIGVAVGDTEGKVVTQFSRYIGVATNNVAEYKAVIEALKWLLNSQFSGSITKVNFYLDSQLVVSQLNGEWKIKNSNLQMLNREVIVLMSQLKLHFKFIFIRRDKNKVADGLVNSCLDNLHY